MVISAKGLIFDFGGTIDTNGIHWGEMIWEAYRHHNVAVDYETYRETFKNVEINLDRQRLIASDDTMLAVLQKKIALQLYHLNIADTELVNALTAYCYSRVQACTARASQTLATLYQRFPLAIASNFYGNLETVLKELDIHRYFSVILDSALCGTRKPDPEIFRLATEQLGFTPAEVCVIGDSYKNDIAPATSLGCQSIWLKVKGWHPADETHTHPNIIHDFNELNRIMNGEL
jgi:putative hydrolase of the HAD superfamily